MSRNGSHTTKESSRKKKGTFANLPWPAIGAITTAIGVIAAAGYFAYDHWGADPEGRTEPNSIRVTACKAPAQIQPGEQIKLGYTIDVTSPTEVGLGAGLYDSIKEDHSTGIGDDDRLQLETGQNTGTRPFMVPNDLEPGAYKLVLEVWPPNRIGADGTETIAERRCAIVQIPPN